MLKLIKATILIVFVSILFIIISNIIEIESRYPDFKIRSKKIEIHNIDSIISQNKTFLIPVDYQGTLDFDTVKDGLKKEKFINFILPPIVIKRELLFNDLHHIEFIETKIKNGEKLAPNEMPFMEGLLNFYDASSIIELKKKIFPPPVSLVLAQAILESGWGSSRAFVHGYNPFGLMSFSKSDKRMKVALAFTSGKEEVYIKCYNSVSESISNYFLIFARGSSYKKFRQKKWERLSTLELIPFLDKYHENEYYNQLITSIVITNNLHQFDDITIDQRYIEHKPKIAYFFENLFSKIMN